jgi:hypothetical protein
MCGPTCGGMIRSAVAYQPLDHAVPPSMLSRAIVSSAVSQGVLARMASRCMLRDCSGLVARGYVP